MRASPSILIAALVAIGAVIGWRVLPDRNDTPMRKIVTQELPVHGNAPEFALSDHNNQPFSTSSLRGKPWVLNFFFSSCQHICPTINGSVKSLATTFEENGVHFVSISVDPKRDTPARLSEYKRKFTTTLSDWHMLAAAEEDITRIQSALRIASGNLPENHTTRMVLVDAAGKIRGYYRALEESEIARLKQDLATLITE